jgi:hypothetical protein
LSKDDTHGGDDGGQMLISAQFLEKKESEKQNTGAQGKSISYNILFCRSKRNRVCDRV